MASVPDALACPGESAVHQGTGGQGRSPAPARRTQTPTAHPAAAPLTASGCRSTDEVSLLILKVWAPELAAAPENLLEMQVIRPHSPGGIRLGEQGPVTCSIEPSR